MFAKALLLKQLYLRKLVGERFCVSMDWGAKRDKVFRKNDIDNVIKHCNLCELSKVANERIVGNLADSKVAFVSLKPILPFSASGEMIDKIAKNVLLTPTYSLLSIIKCNVNTAIKDTHIAVCKEFLKTQLNALNPRLIVFFGAEILDMLLGERYELEHLRGRIHKSKTFLNREQDFIVTYAINDLLRNPSLKRNAWADFQNAQRFLATREAI